MRFHMRDETVNAALDFMQAYIAHLRNDIPAAKRALRQRIAAIDGFPAGTDNPRVSHTADLTSVEAAAHHRQQIIDTDLRGLDDELDAAVKALRNLLNDCRRIIGARVAVERCSGGTGRDGAIEWGRPDCHEVPSRRGMCIACYHRERRWRKAHGLPERDESGMTDVARYMVARWDNGGVDKRITSL